jgi:hypothetical protein
MAKRPSADDIAEVQAGKGSARDRREVAAWNKARGKKKVKRNKRHSKK